MAEVIRRPARWLPVVVVVFAVTAAVLVPSSAQAAKAPPRSFFGIVPNSDLRAADYQLMQQAKIGSARVSLFWQVIEASPGKFDWADSDRRIGEFASRGITVLPLLYGTPAWLASEATMPPVYSDRQMGAWDRFVREAVKRYGEGGTYWRTVYPLQFPGGQPQPIDVWQVWNEQNGPKHFSPRPNVSKYGTLLEIARRAVRAEDPSGQILTGGMASKPTGDGGINAWKFVKKLTKKKVGRKSLDHVALHPYARNHREVASHIKKMRRALKKGRKKKAQVWITEIGWSSVPNGASPKLSKSPKGQQKMLKKTYQRLKRKRRQWKIGAVYWYTWRDFSGGVCDWCPDAGLVTRGLQPKPAFHAFKRIAR